MLQILDFMMPESKDILYLQHTSGYVDIVDLHFDKLIITRVDSNTLSLPPILLRKSR